METFNQEHKETKIKNINQVLTLDSNPRILHQYGSEENITV